MSSEEEHLRETDTEERFDFSKKEAAAFKTGKGLTEETIRVISEDKDEPEWMLKRRLRALDLWQQMPMPTDWPGQPDLSEVDVDEIVPYIRPDVEVRAGVDDWEELPEDIKDTFDKLGIPEAEKNALSGVAPSTSPKSSTRTCRNAGRNRAWSSVTWTRPSSNTRTSSGSTS